MITKTSTLSELYDHAILSARDVVNGEVFIVRDLFRGFEWNRVPKGLRIKLGSMFYAYAQGAASGELEILDKTPQNQQKYRDPFQNGTLLSRMNPLSIVTKFPSSIVHENAGIV